MRAPDRQALRAGQRCVTRGAMTLHADVLRKLRALGHHQEPIVQVGKEGITEGLVAAAARAIFDHELVKVRIGSEAPDDRKMIAAALAEATKAELVQVLGRTALLYKRHPSKPKLLVTPKPEAKTGGTKKKLAKTGRQRRR